MTTKPEPTIDFWFDPVCPYSWTASPWLCEHVLDGFYTAFGEGADTLRTVVPGPV